MPAKLSEPSQSGSVDDKTPSPRRQAKVSPAPQSEAHEATRFGCPSRIQDTPGLLTMKTNSQLCHGDNPRPRTEKKANTRARRLHRKKFDNREDEPTPQPPRGPDGEHDHVASAPQGSNENQPVYFRDHADVLELPLLEARTLSGATFKSDADWEKAKKKFKGRAIVD
ncbi:hypothetical protein GGTG_06603 [Gaeumannomyces tritici R3-111a-1]|uniref:Uncharacterized protein n=1 Tax=Gaeumannomyces tritici (strain R3-111a-1) TaxID=644352 RepID=J3NZA4_GAET3|nr:hypothetical protein GGTG_06603 [Gaeumannomyces tritici R3-111a-1]EJT76687.1 hypothetical protein GGTG_06603 [Gaeumannomyces tritici R3-111a-1]